MKVTVMLVGVLLYALFMPSTGWDKNIRQKTKNIQQNRSSRKEHLIQRSLLPLPTVSEKCGHKCNSSYSINDTWPDSAISWASPNWGTGNYNDDCVCTLHLQIKTSAAISVKFDSSSSIYGTIDCKTDNIKFNGAIRTPPLCGNSISLFSTELMTVRSHSQDLDITFRSSSNDGAQTGAGFHILVLIDVDDDDLPSRHRDINAVKRAAASDETCSYNGLEYTQESSVFIGCKLYTCWCDGSFTLLQPIVYHPGCVGHGGGTGGLTTMPPNNRCGPGCNKTITISSSTSSGIYNWDSENWGISHYPDDCICILKVQVDANAGITGFFNPASSIAGDGSCIYDNIKIIGDINLGPLCGTNPASMSPFFANTNKGDPYEFNVIFTSTSDDGGETENGFSLSLILNNADDTGITTKAPTTISGGVTDPSSTLHCGDDCNKTVTITPTTASGIYHWESKDWGMGGYPEDCICILNVKVDADACLTGLFNPATGLAGSNGCIFDNIKFTGDINVGPLCGTDSGTYTPIFVNTDEGNPYEFNVTFTSSSEDGDNSGNGYSFSLIFGGVDATEVPPRCGVDCNKTVVVTSANDSGVYHWQSDNWGVGNYPEDCVCQLKIKVDADATITSYLDPSTAIAGSGGCVYDNIKFTGDISMGPLCGDSTASFLPVIKNTNEGDPYEFTVTFTSSSEDGNNSDKGYLFSLVYGTVEEPDTTTPAPPYCGVDCNKTITITPSTDSDIFKWESNNWGSRDYPDDCTCILNVKVNANACLTTMFDPGTAIAGSGDCIYDNIQFSGDITVGPLCGTDPATLAPIFINTVEGDPYEFNVTFNSNSGDGGATDNGLSLSLVFSNLGQGGPTTPSPSRCGENCNKTIIITSNTASGVYNWQSNNWGMGDYPEDCTCTLDVKVNSDAFITTLFNPSTAIAGSDSCIYDNIKFTGDIALGPLCGTDPASLAPIFVNTNEGNPYEFSVTFTSNSGDGGATDIGYALSLIVGKDENVIKPTGNPVTTTTLPPPRCGFDCNKTITITSASSSGIYDWKSANWGAANYPEDCTCILNVKVDANAGITSFFNPGTMVAGSGACIYDNIKFTGDITLGPVCGTDITSLSPVFVNTKEGNPYEFNVTFTSTSGDGGATDNGYLFSVVYCKVESSGTSSMS